MVHERFQKKFKKNSEKQIKNNFQFRHFLLSVLFTDVNVG